MASLPTRTATSRPSSPLSRLFSAIGASGQLPPGFHDGVIASIYKAGDRSQPGNYRPITLLNADYRLLAKALANRLGSHLPSIISPAQTAFLPGRCMGENVLLMQLLPSFLKRQERWALAVLCDFFKAYDTVDRSFLFSVMELLGVGAGFLQWARLLLSHTRACALVNGHLSPLATFTAGVRQGCPLAPLLYLFIGQALLCFLRSRGFGIPVAGQQLTADQFADDFKAFLAHLGQVDPFLAAMQRFGDA